MQSGCERKEEVDVIEILVKPREVICTNPSRTENGFRVASANPTHQLFSSAQDWRTMCVISTWKHRSRRLLLTAQNIRCLPRRRPLARAWSQTGIHLPAAHRKIIKCKENLCFQKPQLGSTKTIDHGEENSLSYHNILLIYSFYLKIKVHPKNLWWFKNANVLKCYEKLPNKSKYIIY